jgi:hypothetical protein
MHHPGHVDAIKLYDDIALYQPSPIGCPSLLYQRHACRSVACQDTKRTSTMNAHQTSGKTAQDK